MTTSIAFRSRLPGVTCDPRLVPEPPGVRLDVAAFVGFANRGPLIVQMPAGVPVATFAIGEAGATNAALFAVALLAATDPALATKLIEYRSRRHHDASTAVLPAI